MDPKFQLLYLKEALYSSLVVGTSELLKEDESLNTKSRKGPNVEVGLAGILGWHIF